VSTEVVIRSPFDGREVGRVRKPAPTAVEDVVARAARAFAKTRSIPAFQRAGILRAVAEGIRARHETLARTIASEAGKPMKAARVEAERAAATFQAAAAEVEARRDELLPLDVNASSLGRWGVVRRFPLGPVCAITPFNFPLNLTAHKVAPALAVGAPVVQKPASQTPLSAMALRTIVIAAGWPEDAYAVVPLSGKQGEGLVMDPRLPVVSFTGSGVVGWRLKELAPKKRVWLELGGNAAVIVHADADLEDAVTRILAGGFSYAGQSCISVQRTLVHRSIFDVFRAKLLAGAKNLKTGDPLEETTDVGPMISETEARRAEDWVKEAVAAGATLLLGGGRQGSILEPTVLSSTSPDMKVECQEVFAPVVTLTAYDDFGEALERVNDSRYGLQAGLFTRDLALITRAFETLEVGAIIVNDVSSWRADRMPYGGVKDSGFGREGPAYAMDEFTEPRLLVLRSP
jgi:acyl-CoA reductase-like NAD-dependent aldehyde dehydrogenase